MKHYIKLYKNEHIIYKTVTLILVVAIAIFLFRVVKNTIVGITYPNELLASSNINLTYDILNGKIPYSLNNVAINGEKPPCNYDYPFINSIMAAGLSILIGGRVVAAHYIISFLSMVGTAILGSAIIMRHCRTTIAPTLGFFILMLCHWRYGFVNAQPDGLGVFSVMLVLFLATADNIRYREMWCAVITVASFYIKQYFPFVCISVFAFFFIYNKRQGIKYFLHCTILLAISVILITWKWPLYWTYTVLSVMHGTLESDFARGISSLVSQFKYIGTIFGLMLLLLLGSLILYVKKGKVDDDAEVSLKSTRDRMIVLFLIQIPVQILALLFFGRNDGAFLTYFIQLLIPSLTIVTLVLIETVNIGRYESKFMYVYVIVALITAYMGWGKLPMHMLTTEEVAQWEKVYSMLDEYSEYGEIIHYYPTAFYSYKSGESCYGTGHEAESSEIFLYEWEKSELQQQLFPYANLVYEENKKYKENIRNKIENGNVSLVVMPSDGFRVDGITKYMLEMAGYKSMETIELQLGNMGYSWDFWILDNA